MLDAARSLDLSADTAPELPRVPDLADLYSLGGGSGVRPRQGEMVMIAGRSGSQKSGFALWWCSQMNLPTLYFSADMTARQASIRLACSRLERATEEVEEMLAAGGERAVEVRKALRPLKITFSFGSPITWGAVESELDAWVEIFGAYPKVIVIDNLMDMQGGEADYQAQMTLMQDLHALSRMTEATVMVLHHASDKTWDATNAPGIPPSRRDIKGGLSEKPELILTLGLDPHNRRLNIACVKQRMGPSDLSGGTWATLEVIPEMTLFRRCAGTALRTLGEPAIRKADT